MAIEEAHEEAVGLLGKRLSGDGAVCDGRQFVFHGLLQGLFLHFGSGHPPLVIAAPQEGQWQAHISVPSGCRGRAVRRPILKVAWEAVQPVRRPRADK